VATEEAVFWRLSPSHVKSQNLGSATRAQVCNHLLGF